MGNGLIIYVPKFAFWVVQRKKEILYTVIERYIGFFCVEYHMFISACTSVRQYDNADINEIALIVYNATLNPNQRKSAEMIVGPKLHDQWYKLNEYCIDLKKYFKVAKSARKDVTTTLDDVFGYDLPIVLDFSSSIESETESISSMQCTENCDVPETTVSADNIIYDVDWL